MKSAAALRKPTQTTTVDMSGVNITTSAYATILAKASNLYACSAIEIFNPSGSPMIIAIGDAGSELPIPYTILPGGTTGALAVEINRNVRISAKAYDTTVSSGRFILNQFG